MKRLKGLEIGKQNQEVLRSFLQEIFFKNLPLSRLLIMTNILITFSGVNLLLKFATSIHYRPVIYGVDFKYSSIKFSCMAVQRQDAS